jgi:hypothetical protein
VGKIKKKINTEDTKRSTEGAEFSEGAEYVLACKPFDGLHAERVLRVAKWELEGPVGDFSAGQRYLSMWRVPHLRRFGPLMKHTQRLRTGLTCAAPTGASGTEGTDP